MVGKGEPLKTGIKFDSVQAGIPNEAIQIRQPRSTQGGF